MLCIDAKRHAYSLTSAALMACAVRLGTGTGAHSNGQPLRNPCPGGLTTSQHGMIARQGRRDFAARLTRPLCSRRRLSACLVTAEAAAANSSGSSTAEVQLTMPGQEVDQVGGRTEVKPALSMRSRELNWPLLHSLQVNMVMKFGGSSVASAERMWEVAQIVCSFPAQLPCVVLSAMGKTTNNLLEAGEQALSTPPGSIASLAPLR